MFKVTCNQFSLIVIGTPFAIMPLALWFLKWIFADGKNSEFNPAYSVFAMGFILVGIGFMLTLLLMDHVESKVKEK